jgi:hypothetical protein
MDSNTLLREIVKHRDLAAQGIDVRRNEREFRWKASDLFEWLARGGFPPDWTTWIDYLGESTHDNDDPEECLGHESLAGEHMGESAYCDGSCVS